MIKYNPAFLCAKPHLPTLASIIKKELAQFKKKSGETLESSVGQLLALKDELGLVESAAEEEKLGNFFKNLKSVFIINCSDSVRFQENLNQWFLSNINAWYRDNKLKTAIDNFIIDIFKSQKTYSKCNPKLKKFWEAVYEFIFLGYPATQDILKKLLDSDQETRKKLFDLMSVNSDRKDINLLDFLEAAFEVDDSSLFQDLYDDFKKIPNFNKEDFINLIIQETYSLRADLQKLLRGSTNSLDGSSYTNTEVLDNPEINLVEETKAYLKKLGHYQSFIATLIQDNPNNSKLYHALFDSFVFDEGDLLKEVVAAFKNINVGAIKNLLGLNLSSDSKKVLENNLQWLMSHILRSQELQGISEFKECFSICSQVYKKHHPNGFQKFLSEIIKRELDDEIPLLNNNLRFFILDNLDPKNIAEVIKLLNNNRPVTNSSSRTYKIAGLTLLTLLDISSVYSKIGSGNYNICHIPRFINTASPQEALNQNNEKLRRIFKATGFKNGIYNLLTRHLNTATGVNGFMILSDCLDDNIKHHLLQYYSSNPAEIPELSELPGGTLKDWLTSLKPQ
jgi:hypothetical protein